MPKKKSRKFKFDRRKKALLGGFYITLLVACASGAFFYLNFPTRAVVKTWDGGGTDGTCGGSPGDGNKWTCGANWSPDGLPAGADTVIFDGATSNKNATASSTVIITGLTINANYSGTITQASNFIIGASGFVQNGGTFAGATQTIDINGPLTLNAGTFTSTSGNLTLSGNLVAGSGLTFSHNNGTFTFDGTANTTADVNTSLTLSAVVIDKYSGTSARNLTISANDILIATGALTLTRGRIYTGTFGVGDALGMIEARDTLVNSLSNFGGGSGIIHMTGTTTNTITVSGETFPGMTIDNPYVTITGGRFGSDFTLNAGILNGPVGGVTYFGRNFTLGAGGTFTPGAYIELGKDWSKHSSGTFNAGTSTIVMTYRETIGFTADSTFNDHVFTGNTTFYNFRDGNQRYLGSIKFESGSTQTITNEAKITGLGYAQFGSTNHGSRMPVSSTTPGNAASLNLPASTIMAHISLADINNTGTSFNCNVRCADNGGNTNINFTGSIHIYVSAINRETTESGGTATFTVYLTGRPLNNVTIPVTSSDEGEGTPSTATLTFTSANWETKQTVTVTGQNDADNDGTVAYTIQLGSTTSSDSRFNGLNPDDVSVKNQDNDSAATAIDFDQLSNFDVEDVQNTAASSIGAMYNWGFAQVSFYHDITDYNNSTYIDLTTSKIKPGCKIDIGGTVYTFLTVADEAVYGYSAELGRDGISPYDLDAELSAFDGAVTVNSITCVENQNGGVKLNDDFIKDDARITSVWGGDYAISDTAGDYVFFTDTDADSVRIIKVIDSSVTEVVVGNHPGAIAYDSTRDNIWVVNEYADTVTVIAVATGSVVGTWATDHQPKAIAYDSEHDDIWIGTDDGVAPTVNRYDPSDGSEEASLASDESFYRMAYDPANDVLWLAVYSWGSSSTDYYAHYLVRVNVLDDDYVGDSFAESMVQIPLPGQYIESIEYDATNQLLWITDNLNYGTPVEGSRAFLTQIDTSNGVALGAYEIGYLSASMKINSPRNEVWTMGGEDYVFTVNDLNNGGLENTARAASGSWASFAIDRNGAAWFYDSWADTIEHVVPEGVAADTYYTLSSDASSAVDTTGQIGISAAAVTETLNGQSTYYSVSFDGGDSYKVWGSWRTIASNKTSDHNGTDGDWYYKNNNIPGGWTAASPNTKQAAISAAVAAGANNQMTGTEMEALGEADWEAVGGFESGVTTTLDLAATLYTEDSKDSPTVEKVDFTFSEEAEEPPPPTAPYTSTTVVMSRLKDPTPTIVDLYFSMTNPLLEGTVITTTFEGGAWSSFTAPTGGTGLGTAPSFGTTATGFTVTCGVGGCGPGAVTVTGGGASTPATPGSYTVAITNDQNDDVAYAAVAVVDDDTVTLNAAIDPYLTFDIDIGTSATPGANNSSAPYLVSLGHFSGDVTHGSGADSVPYIELDLATNAVLGVTVTIADTDSVRTLRSGSDDFGSVLSNTALTGAANGYGLCIVDADGLTMSGSYDGDGSADGCTATGGGDDVVTTPAAVSSPEAFLSTASILSTEVNPIIAVKGRSSYTNPAHTDYSTSVRFIATATF